MAFFLNKTSMFQSQKMEDPMFQSRRPFHIEPGAREKALLEKDPALKRFKSSKEGVKRIKIFGNVLLTVVLAGACYEFYLKREARKKEQATTLGEQ
ncbi:hypothetical protein GIB67_032945 [Kingdonia uniflora]|uniref:Uncharacterized protein n=1 Tax=Kingdonia uniflora TaxID=39325 RepID=A0A7J7MY41_9MAGN|nr:hypothetical protein GIB67_032945 [Kingdonia uniflora]